VVGHDLPVSAGRILSPGESTILSLFTTVLTYVIILMQFKQGTVAPLEDGTATAAVAINVTLNGANNTNVTAS
jgi:hypothetical protein